MNESTKPTDLLAAWWQAIRVSGIADSMSEPDLAAMARKAEAAIADQTKPSKDDLSGLIDRLSPDQQRQMLHFSLALIEARPSCASA